MQSMTDEGSREANLDAAVEAETSQDLLRKTPHPTFASADKFMMSA
jgi:hypothetical protein